MHYQCLIVDDEVELSKMTAEYFRMFDISTAYVDSAEACYQFLKENEVDLILLDINLGEGSGFAGAKEPCSCQASRAARSRISAAWLRP